MVKHPLFFADCQDTGSSFQRTTAYRFGNTYTYLADVYTNVNIFLFYTVS